MNINPGKIQGCDHIGLLTNNARRLECFYLRHLKFIKEKEGILPKAVCRQVFGINSDFRFIRLFAGTMKLELFQPLIVRLKKKNKAMTSYHHWGLKVLNRERFCRSLSKKRIKVIRIIKEGNVVYFVEDPDGNRIEIRH